MFSCTPSDVRLFNVIHISVCFLLLYSADFTIVNMQKTINTSITEENPEYNIDGYLTLCLLYGLYGITLWLAPSFISVIGYKLSLVIGSFFLAFYTFSLTLEIVWTTYLGILLGGVAGSFIWAAEGHYLVLNSDAGTMSRNTGIFWALYSASLIPGNIYAATEFSGKTHIDKKTRHKLLYSMTVLALISTGALAFLRRPPGTKKNEMEAGPLNALKKTWRLFCSRDMMVLLIMFIYGGFQQSFGSGVYSPSLGFTKDFGSAAKQLVPISGMLYGVGDSLGGICYMVIDKWGVQYSRRHIIMGGFILQTLAFIGTYLNLPNSSVFGETDEKAIITSQIWLALVCSFLIGVGDSCINTQIFPLLRDLHPNYSAHTCCLYKFSKSMAMAMSYFCSSYMGLHLQLSIMFGMGVLGVIAFSYVDIRQSSNVLELGTVKIREP